MLRTPFTVASRRFSAFLDWRKGYYADKAPALEPAGTAGGASNGGTGSTSARPVLPAACSGDIERIE